MTFRRRVWLPKCR